MTYKHNCAIIDYKTTSTTSTTTVREEINMIISTSEFIKEYTPKEVYVDESFQRRVVWPNETGSAWLASLTHDTGFKSPLSMVNIRKSLKKALNNCSDDHSDSDLNVKYFRTLLNQGYEWISIDGQNRTKCLLDFINNKTPITCRGDYACKDMDGMTHEFEGVYYKDLPVRLQDKFQASQHLIQESTCDSIKLMAHYFRSINDGHALNDQEKRQSYQTEIAAEVRNFSKIFKVPLAKVVPKDKICRMDDDELMAKMLMVIMHPEKGLSRQDLDNFYTMSLHHQVASYSGEALHRVEKILDLWGSTLEQQQIFKAAAPIPNKTSWALLYACIWAHDNNYTTTDHEVFFEKLVELDKQLCDNSEANYYFERQKCLKAGNDPKKAVLLIKSNYYHNLTGLPQKPNERNTRIGCLTAAIMLNPAKFRLCSA